MWARDSAIASFDLLNTDHLEAIIGLCIDKLRALDLDGLDRSNGGHESEKGSEKSRLDTRARAMISAIVIFVDLQRLDPSGPCSLCLCTYLLHGDGCTSGLERWQLSLRVFGLVFIGESATWWNQRK